MNEPTPEKRDPFHRILDPNPSPDPNAQGSDDPSQGQSSSQYSQVRPPRRDALDDFLDHLTGGPSTQNPPSEEEEGQ